ncbi:hypothetical protein JOD31_003530 [Methylopila capsulata]|uniref:DUF4259 domain-containing protein n=1 Tax=Methylopila capsulata TaxID=61654 RepID=A0A9W6MT72_9HYPH|nr:DUF4259 domain-containing protein [Methylopila capsulata]MBM7853279.1 hypothetical protein [Methylopila capsulata]GLK57505.1 hypothetical protein GCM10008170_35250 [Methylopila capsulata]
MFVNAAADSSLVVLESMVSGASGLMGTWDLGHLANDEAAELQAEFEADRDARIFLAAFAAATLPTEVYLERPEAQRAVAAAHLLAESHRLGAGIRGPAGEDLCRPAIHALRRIRQDQSELQELWDESPSDGPQWRAGMDRLIHDLQHQN